MPNKSKFFYALNLLWLLTDNKMISTQLKKGYSTEYIIEDLKKSFLSSNLLDNYPNTFKRELTDSLLFLIKERIEENSKLSIDEIRTTP